MMAGGVLEDLKVIWYVVDTMTLRFLNLATANKHRCVPSLDKYILCSAACKSALRCGDSTTQPTCLCRASVFGSRMTMIGDI